MDKQQTENVFRRLLRGGVVRRLPKNRKDAEIFLALMASSFNPRLAYSEAEVNEHLLEWMADFTCPVAMDHLTIRRSLIDFRLLLRDVAGIRYTTNQTIINNTIEPAARSIQPRQILVDVQREKERRKRATATKHTV